MSFPPPSSSISKGTGAQRNKRHSRHLLSPPGGQLFFQSTNPANPLPGAALRPPQPWDHLPVPCPTPTCSESARSLQLALPCPQDPHVGLEPCTETGAGGGPKSTGAESPWFSPLQRSLASVHGSCSSFKGGHSRYSAVPRREELGPKGSKSVIRLSSRGPAGSLLLLLPRPGLQLVFKASRAFRFQRDAMTAPFPTGPAGKPPVPFFSPCRSQTFLGRQCPPAPHLCGGPCTCQPAFQQHSGNPGE